MKLLAGLLASWPVVLYWVPLTADKAVYPAAFVCVFFGIALLRLGAAVVIAAAAAFALSEKPSFFRAALALLLTLIVHTFFWAGTAPLLLKYSALALPHDALFNIRANALVRAGGLEVFCRTYSFAFLCLICATYPYFKGAGTNARIQSILFGLFAIVFGVVAFLILPSSLRAAS